MQCPCKFVERIQRDNKGLKILHKYLELFSQYQEADAIIIPNLQASKLKYTEIKQLPQGHITGKWQSWNLTWQLQSHHLLVLQYLSFDLF